jgi:hypothetical protein
MSVYYKFSCFNLDNFKGNVVRNVKLHVNSHVRNMNKLAINFEIYLLHAIAMHNKLSSIYCLFATDFSSQDAAIFQEKYPYLKCNVLFCTAFVNLYFKERYFHLQIVCPSF